MGKIINISENKFNKILRKIVSEEFDGVENNYEPFEDQMQREGTPYENTEDGHGESIVGKNIDPTYYNKNQGLNDIVNPGM